MAERSASISRAPPHPRLPPHTPASHPRAFEHDGERERSEIGLLIQWRASPADPTVEPRPLW